jgi:putative ABC transport system ATP-binding protein
MRAATAKARRITTSAADEIVAPGNADSTKQPGSAQSVVRIEHLTKQYRIDAQNLTALRDINLKIDEGVFLAIAGPSGSGKSTLLNLIGCIDSPTSGRLLIDGDDVATRSPDQLASLRSRAIGFVFQTFNLFPVLSAEENVEYPLLKRRDIGSRERKERGQRYLAMVGLANFAEHRPNQLSGGQRQRVAIARALVNQPRIVLADEPTANLDHKTGERILRLMKKINRRTGTTFVFSTHDQKVLDMADRRVDLEDGQIVRLGIRVDGNWVFAMERESSGDTVGPRVHERDL